MTTREASAMAKTNAMATATGTAMASGTAGPSTAPFAKCANGFAQDDKVLKMDENASPS
jgi:hypothetical protein